MAVTLSQLAVQLRVIANPDAPVPEPQASVLSTLLAWANAEVLRRAPGAPDASVDMAVISLAGYVYDSPMASRGAAYSNAWAGSMAAQIMRPWTLRRGVSLTVEQGEAGAGVAGLSDAQVRQIVLAAVAKWALAGEPEPQGRTIEQLQDAVAAMFSGVSEVTYNDNTGKLSIAFPAGNGGSGRTLEQLQDAVAAMFSGVSEVTYNDNTGKLSIAFPAGGGGGRTLEQLQDAVAAMFSGVSEVTYNDTTGKLSIAFPAGNGGSGRTLEQLQDAVAIMWSGVPAVRYNDTDGKLTLPLLSTLTALTADLRPAPASTGWRTVDSDGAQGGVALSTSAGLDLAGAATLSYRSFVVSPGGEYGVFRIPKSAEARLYRYALAGNDVETYHHQISVVHRIGVLGQWQYFLDTTGEFGEVSTLLTLQVTGTASHVGETEFGGKLGGGRDARIPAIALPELIPANRGHYLRQKTTGELWEFGPLPEPNLGTPTLTPSPVRLGNSDAWREYGDIPDDVTVIRFVGLDERPRTDDNAESELLVWTYYAQAQIAISSLQGFATNSTSNPGGAFSVVTVRGFVSVASPAALTASVYVGKISETDKLAVKVFGNIRLKPILEYL